MRFLLLLLLYAPFAFSQDIPSRWDELTADDWPKALERSGRTCILPIGILEKHGPHAPLGSDLIHVREWAARVTKKEYAVVFPDFFYGQINEARHQPGTFSLPSRLVMELLDSTCAEIARNGFQKIVIINGHGGNPNMIRYFIQTQLERRRNYAVFFFEPAQDTAYTAQLRRMHRSDMATDQHAGERETSTLLYLRPDLVKQFAATKESGGNLQRLSLPNLYTGIWWYASYPNHYAGDGTAATRELGRFITEHIIESLRRSLVALKADTKTIPLQNEFYDRVLRGE